MPTYAKGRVEPPNLDHLRQLSYARNRGRLARIQTQSLPVMWDSRTQGWVGAIKDQGGCGSCWDFSGTGVIEIAFNKAGIGGGPDKMIFSEQYTLSCGRNGGCNGDDNTTVLDWAKTTGLPLSSDYGSYDARPDSCRFKSGMRLWKIDDWGFADSNGGNGITPVADIKAAIVSYGSVGCAIAANNQFDNVDPSRVFMGGGNQSINHDVILIGWDDTKLNRSGRTAWLLRNQWSTQWGDNGYLWIADGANQVGTEAVFAVVNPVTPPTPTPIPIPTPTPGPQPSVFGGFIDFSTKTYQMPSDWTEIPSR